MRKLLGCIKRAQANYSMIHEGDVIGVGLSGGKDSIALLYALYLYQNFSPVKYSIKAITIDLGFEGFQTDVLTSLCNDLEIECVIEKTKIGKLIFEERKDTHPCGMCARMRRGRLIRVCKEKNITKLALGHHGDDAAETLLMSMLYERRVHTFSPITYFDRTDFLMIRPFIYAAEQDIIDAVKRHNLPTVQNPCPASGSTKREMVKSLILALDDMVPNGHKNLIAAATKPFI